MTEMKSSPTQPSLAIVPHLPNLIRAKQAASLCGVSVATWHRHVAAGRTPAPVKLGGGVFYRIDELHAWISHNCPLRREWAAIWAKLKTASM